MTPNTDRLIRTAKAAGRDGERGIALITSLLISTLLLALGIAVAFSTTSDTVISRSHRVSEQAFFAADAGLALGRRALAAAIEEEFTSIKEGKATYGENGTGFYKNPVPGSGGSLDQAVEIIPDPVTNPNYQFYVNVRERAAALVAAAESSNRLQALNGTSYVVEFIPSSRIFIFDPDEDDPKTSVQEIQLYYSIRATGETEAGGRASVVETGRVSTSLTFSNSAIPGTGRDFKFSGFAAFFDNGDTSTSAYLAAGTFKGPVHTNTHFSFDSNRTVAFSDVISQVESTIRYRGTNNRDSFIAIPTQDIKGIDLGPQGYKQTDNVPLPDNNFSQEYAVINGSGITDLRSDGSPVDPPGAIPEDNNGNELPVFDSSGRVTADALAANLRDAVKNKPTVNTVGGNKVIANGIYISSSDGTSITGAGIYVQGDADDIQMKAGSNGRDQIYVIKQGSKTVTITVKPDSNTTTVSNGNQSTTYTGVPTDKSLDFKDQTKWKPGMSLFVNGGIKSLRGGTTSSSSVAALAPGTRTTITAQRDIVITGDIKFTDRVVDGLGDPVTNYNQVQNVLGIFTNDGNVEMNPSSSFVSSGLSLRIDAAIVAFNSNTSNDGGGIEGSIVYTGATPKSSDTWTLIGSRVQAKINNIGYSKRDIFFDPRFRGGNFAPPFFPGTSYNLGQEEELGGIAIAKVSSATPTGMTWYRENN
jgi:hypothetical protein